MSEPLLEPWQKAVLGVAGVGLAAGAAVLIFRRAGFAVSPRQRVVQIAESQIGQDKGSTYASATRENNVPPRVWCGIFALWALRQARLTNWYWDWGTGFIGKLPRTRNPKPGDIAFKEEPYQHQAVLRKIANGFAYTVDGNSYYGKVQPREHPVSYWTAFYSIEPLIQGCRSETSCVNFRAAA